MNNKRKISRISLILLSMIVVILMLTGCGADPSSATPTPSNVPSPSPAPGTNNNNNNGTTGDNPLVTITMRSGGVIVIELYPDLAPNTVNSFISLINKGFYNGLTFHRIVPGFVLQGGDPNGNGTGGPGYFIPGEFPNNAFTQNTLKHERGVVSMARRGPRYANEDPKPYYNTAGSQFFIMLDDVSSLDDDYAPFGRVIDGMDEVDRIAAVETDTNDKPISDEIMDTVTVDTFGITYPEPETLPDSE